MHIARVVHIFYPEGMGDPFGACELSMRQVARIHRVTVITWARKATANREDSDKRFEVYRLKALNFKLVGMISEYPFFPSLPAVLKNIKPDLIDAHSHLFLTTFFAVREAQKLRLPSVVTVHGVSAERNTFLNLIQQIYLRTVGRWIFRNANRVVCLTESDAYRIMRLGVPRSKIRIVPNAVNLRLFKPSKKKPNYPLFVWTGRFVPEKGLRYLVKAMDLVVRECKDARFTLIGDGPILPLIKVMVKRSGLNNHVWFTGPIDPISVSRILSRATGFVFPSLREGMPVAVLEAMACGLPIIASDIPGLNELLVDEYNGLLVPPMNPEALAKAIGNVISDDDLAMRLGANARKTVETKHDWRKILDALDSVYEEAWAEVKIKNE